MSMLASTWYRPGNPGESNPRARSNNERPLGRPVPGVRLIRGLDRAKKETTSRAVPPSQGRRRASGYPFVLPLRGGPVGWRGRSGRPPRSRIRTKASLPPGASRTVKNWPAGDVQPSPDARITGQKGHGSAKQAVPRTAPPARTLSLYVRNDRHAMPYSGMTRLNISIAPYPVVGGQQLSTGARIPLGRERVVPEVGRGSRIRSDRGRPRAG